MDETTQQLEKARIWAYWGFSGLFNPIVGIISSSISLSILDRLVVEDDEDVISEHARITGMANMTRVLSIVILVLMVVGAIFATTQVMDSMKKQTEAEAAYQKALEDYKSSY
jgi:hypothetical protein